MQISNIIWCTFVDHPLPYVQIYFCIFYPVPQERFVYLYLTQIYLSIFMPIPCCFDSCNLKKNLEVRQCKSCNFILLFKVPCQSQVLEYFSDSSVCKESACNAGDLDLISGLEDPLEKGKATCSSILAWRIPWTTVHGGGKKSDTIEQLSLSHYEFQNQLINLFKNKNQL